MRDYLRKLSVRDWLEFAALGALVFLSIYASDHWAIPIWISFPVAMGLAQLYPWKAFKA